MACACKDIKAGELKRSATLQTGTKNRDAQGGRSVLWADTKTIRCKIEHKAGNEFFARQNINSSDRVIFTTRYDSTITQIGGLKRIKYNNKIYNITWINNVEEMNRFQIITTNLEAMRNA